MTKILLVGAILLTSMVSLAYAQTETTPATTTVAPIDNSVAETASPTAPAAMPAQPAPATTTLSSAAVVQGAIVMLPRQESGQILSSKIVGASVYGMANEKIGEVSDLILSSDGAIVGVVVGVGGFLGMGEKNVAVTYASIIKTKDDKGAAHYTLRVTKEALKAATAYEPAKKG